MIEIARMLPQEEWAVRQLYASCHPTWTPRPKHWFDLNPTSVALEGHRVVAARSVTVDPTCNLMHLQGLMVDPSVRGRGVGDLLFNWEIDRAIEMGVRSFLSTTWPANATMRRLFERNGFHPCVDVPGYYVQNDPPADGIVYARHVGIQHLIPQCKGH